MLLELLLTVLRTRPFLRLLTLILQGQSVPAPTQINNYEGWQIIRGPSGLIEGVVVHRNVKVNQPTGEEEPVVAYPKMIVVEYER